MEWEFMTLEKEEWIDLNGLSLIQSNIVFDKMYDYFLQLNFFFFQIPVST